MQRNNNFEKRDYRELYTPKGNKFVIGTVTGKPFEITAQYNPKELARTANAAWTTHPNTSAKQSKSGDTSSWMEYGTSEPRSLVLELLFDGYEEGISIADKVEQLESLTLPLDRQSNIPENRHPQLCVAVWGSQQLRCVVVSVTTKLTMFDASGEPLRATCSVTLKEVDVVAMMKHEHSAGASGYDTRVADLQKKSGDATHERRRHWVDDRQIVDAKQRADLRGPSTPSSSEPAWTPPPPPNAKPAQPVVATHVDGMEDEDDQDLADDQALQAQNEQDRKADDARDAAEAAPKPTETVAGTNAMPGGTYGVGAPSEKVDPNTIESSDPPKPSETVAGTNQMPGGTYEVGTPSEKVDPNTLESSEPASHPVDPEILGELE